MQLPEEFEQQTCQLMGEELYRQLKEGLRQSPPVSIRLNPFKCEKDQTRIPLADGHVAWCHEGFYLSERPNFTFDPLLHAGAYYVQEASSMFLDHVLQQLTSEGFLSETNRDFACLDMCAAPGGKSTILMNHLPKESLFISNEPVPKRAWILSENLQKWALAAIGRQSSSLAVTNNSPGDFRKAKLTFDLILCDVPCSGEGMFRKDPDSIGEWSQENVGKCWRLQRDIIEDAWTCLNPGGVLIYSTCTLNTKENEENVRWMMEQFEADPMDVTTEPGWHITGSLLPNFTAPVYRFIPGLTRGEGLFMAVLRKRKGKEESGKNDRKKSYQKALTSLRVLPNDFLNDIQEAIAHHAPVKDLSYEQAISYLRREAITLPADTPRGIVIITYCGHILGLAKNIGNRANNLYPKQWRITSTHIPEENKIIAS